MMRALRELWRHSALPVILLLAALFGVGAWLQSRAIRVQGAPLLIAVGPEPGITAETAVVDTAPAVPAVMESSPAAPAVEGTAADEARAAFAEGLALQRKGDSPGAAAAYRRALGLRPTFHEAAFNLGTVLLAEDQVAEAAAALAAAVPLAGGERRARTLTALAGAYSRQGRFPEAEGSFQEAINLAPSDLRARVGLARLYREKMQRPADALRLFREAVRLDEQYAPAWIGMAELRLDKGDTLEAERLLERAVALDPASEEGRIALASLLAQRGETTRAREHLVWLVDHVEKPVEAHFRLGRLDYGQQLYQQAAEQYRAAIAASGGTHVPSLNNLGLSLKALGDGPGARRSFEQALAREPDSTSAHYNLGLLALEAEDLAEAQARFQRVVRIDPTHAEAWYNLGLVSGLREAPRDAIAAYQAALSIDPSDAKARLNLAVQYRRAGEPARAAEQYRILLVQRPSYAAAWFNLALVLRDIGKSAEAEDAYRSAIRAEPGEAKYRSGLALLYADTGRPADAARLFQEALEIDPRDAASRYNLAVQQRRLGRSDLAIEDARRAVAVEPGFKKGWLLLADLLAATDDHRGAAEALGHALAADPADPLTRYELGKQQFELGEHAAAADSHREALKKVRDNAWIWYHLGKAEQALGRGKAAQDAYKASLAVDPDMARFISRQVGEPRDALAMIRAQLADDPRNAGLRLALADQLQRSGAGTEAVAEVNAVLKENPSSAAAWKTLADIYVDQEAYAAGEEALARARSLLPRDADVAFQLGRMLVRREKLAQALPHLSFAVEHAGDPLPALRLLGNTQYDLREYRAAASTLTRAVALQPDHGNTVIDLGKSFYRMKDYAKALERFAEARRLMPEYAWSGVWLGRAYAGLGDFTRAEAVYRQVAEKEPGFAQAYLGLGDVAEHRGDKAAARDHYRRVLQIDPLNETARDRLTALR